MKVRSMLVLAVVLLWRTVAFAQDDHKIEVIATPVDDVDALAV